MATKGDLTRGRILDDAQRIFHRKGFSSTTIRDLLDATGTTRGNLYFHFAGKDAVGLAVLQRAHERFRQFLEESLQGETPAASLENFFHGVLERNRRKGFVGGCLFGNTALETSDSAPQFAGLVRSVFAEWTGKLSETISRAQAAGQLRRDLPADSLAELVVETLEGAIMQARLHKDEGPLIRALATLRTLLELRV